MLSGVYLKVSAAQVFINKIACLLAVCNNWLYDFYKECQP
jgi:hypothetical protein